MHKKTIAELDRGLRQGDYSSVELTQHYLERIARIRELIPNASMSTDIIAGFPTETEEDHRRTLDLMERVRYDGAYTFNYSPRENTKAWAMGDDVPDEVKSRRLSEISLVTTGVRPGGSSSIVETSRSA